METVLNTHLTAGLVAAVILFGSIDVFHAFSIMEKEDIFKKTPCPAFLMFENAAYLADMSFELPCNCKPEEIKSVVWYFQKSMGSEQTKVLTDFDGTLVVDSTHIKVGSDMLRRFSIRMFSLIVFRVQVEDSGHYICGTKKGDFFYGYDVDVQASKSIAVAFADKDQHPHQDQEEKYFKVFTAFWDWTKCNRCDVRGEQRRIGLCYVKSLHLLKRYHTTSEEVASCGSGSIPKRFRKVIQIRKPEVVIRSCTVPCRGETPSSEGESSISDVISKLGEKPWVSNIPMQYHRQSLGSGLIISCPGARPEHAVAWDKDSTRLYLTRFLTGVNKSMRVFIDHGNHLHIRFTQLNDKGIYYCWREGQIVAGFRLSVIYESRRKRNLDDPETQYAVKAILTSYVFITLLFLTILVTRCCIYAFKCSATE
ncbi:Ig-like V-type domain-containing protein FAM187A [Sceloporus undulatus]|uniref:Ig-like V-type domain-containing protein FAM187A n=1 Tax=Sceloporus undulatus TaxID=8520 RepID=UPI001C4D449E|nr:Ig-like V-type domain-containing protein FAM187A [Sceloporus undulatus]